MSYMEKCLLDALANALSRALGLDEKKVGEILAAGKVKLARTPDPSMGDFGIALHYVLKDIDRSSWQEIGERIAEAFLSIAGECRVRGASFINGYLNIRLDYSGLLAELIELHGTGELRRKLSEIGGGTKVVVEHTSANPVHPLHIGSGRNSALGDTFARLLGELGFDVNRRFYVNDLGRQVAVLLYGAMITEKGGLRPGDGVKVDHWYGVIYALTNLIAEVDRLSGELSRLRDEVLNRLLELSEEASALPPRSVIELSLILGRRGLKLDGRALLREAEEVIKVLKAASIPPRAQTLVKEVEELLGKYGEALGEYEDYYSAMSRLGRDYPDIYRCLRRGIGSYEEFEKSIAEIMERAEGGDPEIRGMLRRISFEVLKGFRDTLRSLNIDFEGFDYESSDDIVRIAQEIVESSLRTPYARVVDGAVEVSLSKAAEDISYVRELFYPDDAGRFIIRRSNGTTLYVTRDIAYTILKFRELGARRVYNVIAVEQARAQKQLRAMLYILGYREYAVNLVHFSYEMVHLKHMKMSGRRGVYYTLDELLRDMEGAIRDKHLRERGALLDEGTARQLAVNNSRALLISVEPNKVLAFDESTVSEFEHGITLTYGFARIQGVLRRAFSLEPLDRIEKLRSSLLELLSSMRERPLPELSREEKALLEDISFYEKVLIDAYRDMRPDKLLEYGVNLVQDFNKLYEKHSITGEKDPLRRNIRLALTTMAFLVLERLMDILGFEKPRRL